MRIHQEIVEVPTNGRGPVDVTSRVRAVVRVAKVRTGLCTVFLQHTSAGLLIQENADPAVMRDFGSWFGNLAPESTRWEHDDEGADDMPAHLRSVLTRTSENIPVSEGELALGTWQGLYVWEHRTSPHRRRLLVHVAGVGQGDS